MSRSRIAVVKVGGSLLTTADFATRMRAWLDGKMSVQADTHFVLIVGGGIWVDAIRELDACAPLGEECAHRICVEMMDVTAGLVAAMLPEIRSVDAFGELRQRARKPGVTLLKPSEFVERIEPTHEGMRLPADWSVTSDSIAGRLAIVIGADEFVLLKSAPPPGERLGGDWLGDLANAGYVDAFLPRLRDELPPLELVGLF